VGSNIRTWDEKLAKLMYLTTDQPVKEIAKELGTTPAAIYTWAMQFPKSVKRLRKKRAYRESRLGDKNPAYGKPSPQRMDRCEDGKGYYLVRKPDWFTGRPGSKHIYEHQAVYCKDRGLTELPPKHVIHHLDGDKMNNDPNNLIMLSNVDHLRLHRSIDLQNLSGRDDE